MEGGLSAHPRKNPDPFWCRRLGLVLYYLVLNHIISVLLCIKPHQDKKIPRQVSSPPGVVCYLGCLGRLIPVSIFTGDGLYCRPDSRCKRNARNIIISCLPSYWGLPGLPGQVLPGQVLPGLLLVPVQVLPYTFE